MRKVIQVNGKTIVVMNDGECLSKERVSNEELEQLINNPDDNVVYNIMCESYSKTMQDIEYTKELLERIEDSYCLDVVGDSIYWSDISPLSVPKELVIQILDAEDNGDDELLDTYRNFWTLMSLNPNEECRKNLFWFLQKYGMTIAKCGFFVGYRNVDTTNEDGVYTDNYTHRMRIKIGEMVTLPREQCDCDSKVSCSKGLHIANIGWLKENYCGSVGLACLVNPADVVAVPHDDDYGKLRTCAYLPIEVIDYEDGEIVPIDETDGFECEYVGDIIYKGLMSNEKESYKITIPELPSRCKVNITENLLDIAKESIMERVRK